MKAEAKMITMGSRGIPNHSQDIGTVPVYLFKQDLS
jgi:hypothetical protein